jgi:hypothetical protein
MPSLFSTASPLSAFQIWFVVYLYLVAFMLWAAWASLSVMDLIESGAHAQRPWMILIVTLVPWLGAGWYMLARARVLSRKARLAAVIAGAAVWLIPLAAAVWLVGRPLGPKALG